MGKLIQKVKKHPFCTGFIVLSVILLAAVIVLTCLLFRKKQLDYVQEYYSNKCFSYSVQNINLAKGQIVFLGDSITDLYVLDDYYADLPLAAYNRGIGGDTSSGLLARLQVSALDLQPKTIVLMIGTNDINGGVAEDTLLQNYEEILDTLTQGIPGVEIYCMSIIPQNKQIEGLDVDKSMEKIRQINPKIQTLAEEKGAVYLDIFPLLLDENGYLHPSFTDDGLHLNANGFAVWTDLLKPYLQ